MSPFDWDNGNIWEWFFVRMRALGVNIGWGVNPLSMFIGAIVPLNRFLLASPCSLPPDCFYPDGLTVTDLIWACKERGACDLLPIWSSFCCTGWRIGVHSVTLFWAAMCWWYKYIWFIAWRFCIFWSACKFIICWPSLLSEVWVPLGMILLWFTKLNWFWFGEI